MLIPIRLAFVTDKMGWPLISDEQRMLSSITNINLSATEARTIWPQIEEHKWYVSERLGRDVGLRVAALDYLENIHGAKACRGQAGSLAGSLRRGAKQLAGLYLAHENWKAHQGRFSQTLEEFVWPGSANSRAH